LRILCKMVARSILLSMATHLWTVFFNSIYIYAAVSTDSLLLFGTATDAFISHSVLSSNNLMMY
jgi:hypothetical protein